MNNPHLFEVNVPRGIVEVTVMAGTMDRPAKWAVSEDDSDDTRSGHQVDVRANTTPINITVTAEDRTTAKYYRVTVNRASSSASSTATLSALTVTPGMENSPGTLDTKFEYSVDVAYGGGTVAIAATPSVPLTDGTVVTYKKGDEVIPTTGLSAVAIDEGDNTITVEVIPPSYVVAHKKTYTLTINRASLNASDDARLSSLSLSSGTLMPAFDPNALIGTGVDTENAHAYTVRVPNSVASLTVRAEATSTGAMVSINSVQDDSVSGGAVDLVVNDSTTPNNVINITVTAEDRTTAKHYQINIVRASSSASSTATLSALTVTPGMQNSPGTLDTKFEYSVDVAYGGGTVAIAATPSVPLTDGTVVTYKKGDEVIPATGLGTVAIDEGDNTITVEVMPPSYVAAHKKTYTLTINRASLNASDDARLSSLSLSSGTLMPAFDPNALIGTGVDTQNAHAYTVRVPNSVASLTVRAEATSTGAMVSINSVQDDSVSGGAVDLVVNDSTTPNNVINITVTAEDRTTAKYYQINIVRVTATASPNAAPEHVDSCKPYSDFRPCF